jgi:hypothetical protein
VPCFVTGIVQTSDVSELEKTLGDLPNVDRTRLSVITKSEPTEEHDDSFLNFIHASGPEIESGTMGRIGGDTIMTGGGGTGVPGMNASGASVNILFSEHITRHIGTLPIPDDEVENYSDALHDGRTVVAYECNGSDAAAVEAAMHQAGVRKVKTFAS